MKRTGMIATAAILLMVVAALAAGKNTGAPTLVIPGGTKADVTLPHELHQKVLENCDRCHNLFPQTAGAIAKLKESGDLKKMQVMRQCMDCHRDLAKAGQKAGPVKCSECHKE